ncbi:MAG TPA: hypothetical protein VKZ89_21045 [Thermobifida alba]|nr:hypothetical protein [Thermobifida alba]
MSKPSLTSRISDAFKRLFGRSTRPVVSSKPADMAAGDVPAERAEGAVTETTPAETADADAAAEFATEAVSSGEQQPSQPPAPVKPLETAKAPEAAAAPGQAPEEPSAGAGPAEEAESAKEAASAQHAEPEKQAESAQDAEPRTAEPSAESLTAEEKAEIAETLNVAEATTVEAPTSAFTEAVREAEEAGAAGEEPAGQAAAPEQAPVEAPLPNYDSLTLPSVRARLRKLTIDEVRQLRAYEVAHANRPEFVRMFENRVKKLEDQQSAE